MGLVVGRAYFHIEVRVREGGSHQIIRGDRGEEGGFQLHFPVDIHGESAPGRGVFESSLIHGLPNIRRSSHPDIADVVDSNQATPAGDCAAVEVQYACK
jgi:hypothetical protein